MFIDVNRYIQNINKINKKGKSFLNKYSLILVLDTLLVLGVFLVADFNVKLGQITFIVNTVLVIMSFIWIVSSIKNNKNNAISILFPNFTVIKNKELKKLINISGNAVVGNIIDNQLIINNANDEIVPLKKINMINQ